MFRVNLRGSTLVPRFFVLPQLVTSLRCKSRSTSSQSKVKQTTKKKLSRTAVGKPTKAIIEPVKFSFSLNIDDDDENEANSSNDNAQHSDEEQLEQHLLRSVEETMPWRKQHPATSHSALLLDEEQQEDAADDESESSSSPQQQQGSMSVDEWSGGQLARLGQRLAERRLASESVQKQPTKAASSSPRSASASTTSGTTKLLSQAQWLVPESRPKYLDNETERQTRLAIRSLLMYYHACIKYGATSSSATNNNSGSHVVNTSNNNATRSLKTSTMKSVLEGSSLPTLDFDHEAVDQKQQNQQQQDDFSSSAPISADALLQPDFGANDLTSLQSSQ